ncbi:DUF5667 domain-containing protein [Pseudonocardia saturnea]
MSAGQGPADSGWDAEQLDAAIGQGTPPGLVTDPELARDLEIVAMLRSRRAAFDPHPAARADSKQRLMAALLAAQAEDRAAAPAPHPAELTAPIPTAATGASDETAVIGRVPLLDDTVLSDTVTGDEPDEAPAVEAPLVRPGRAGRHSLPSRPGSRSRSRSATRPATTSLRRRFAVVGAAAMVALIALAAAGNFASRNALPGDALYAMKRIAENTGLALTFDDQERAQRHLELATTRLDEVEQLVSAPGSTTAADPALVESAMHEFDASTGEGSRMLLGADDAPGAAALGDLRAWAVEQAARLSVLRSSLPDPAVAEADTSIALLDRLLGRTEALEARSSCSEVTSSTVDDLGRLPAEGTCSPRAQLADDPSTSATEGGSATTTTPDGSVTTSPDGTTPQDTPTSDGSEGGGLLPQLGPDGLPLPDTGEVLSSNTSGATGESDDVSIPLPLVPPIQLPPLLPGMPGVSIG